jgi:acyl carrier protein phosphodiesterase
VNFLGHAYLSFGSEEILVGNMISDFVKGKAWMTYPEEIKKGIRLHRMIDAYTDDHSAIKEVKQIFRTDYRLYSAPIVDVLLDHFLANNPAHFTNTNLGLFTQSIYQTLEKQTAVLPPRFVHMFYYMKKEDWLYHYHTKAGIERSLHGLVRRSAFLQESERAVALFNKHYDDIVSLSNDFFKDVKVFAKEQWQLLNEQ